jgi:hypothetical protein
MKEGEKGWSKFSLQQSRAYRSDHGQHESTGRSMKSKKQTMLYYKQREERIRSEKYWNGVKGATK